jgi:hypothetical protein
LFISGTSGQRWGQQPQISAGSLCTAAVMKRDADIIDPDRARFAQMYRRCAASLVDVAATTSLLGSNGGQMRRLGLWIDPDRSRRTEAIKRLIGFSATSSGLLR